VCQNILKATVQHTALFAIQYFISVLKEITQAQAIAGHKEWSLFIFLELGLAINL
jgi:hypothetical protein